MTDSDKPLHVQCAEALGWTDLHPRTGGHWWGREPHGGLTISVPRYDTSWCSAGPLLERMDFDLKRRSSGWEASEDDWHAIGDTPCQAVTKLIVTLHNKGKLPK